MVCIGSCMDQVVPLFSATVMAISSHPNLLRAFYIDNLFPLSSASAAPSSSTPSPSVSSSSSSTNPPSGAMEGTASSNTLSPSPLPSSSGGSQATSTAPSMLNTSVNVRPRSSSITMPPPPPPPPPPSSTPHRATAMSRASIASGTRHSNNSNSNASVLSSSGIPTPIRSSATATATARGSARVAVMASPARVIGHNGRNNRAVITSVGVAAAAITSTTPPPLPLPSSSSSFSSSPPHTPNVSSLSLLSSPSSVSPLPAKVSQLPSNMPPSWSSSMHDNDIDDEEAKNMSSSSSPLSSTPPSSSSVASLLPSLPQPPLIAASMALSWQYNASLIAARHDFLVVLLDTIFQLQLADTHANGSTELLIHISSFIRGRLLDRNGGAHSAIHSELDCYRLGTEWAFAGHGRRHHVTVNHQSLVVLAPLLSESFASSSLTKYLIEVRALSLLQAASHHRELNDQVQRLRSCYARWVPPLRLKPFRDALEPVFVRRSRL